MKDIFSRALKLRASAVVACGISFSSPYAAFGSAADLLAQDLAAGTKSLPRLMRIYHYFNVGCSFGPSGASSEWCRTLETTGGRRQHVSHYIASVTGRFWDLNYRANEYINAGPGIYLAVDPYVAYSQKLFGTTMIELMFPAGTPYLNVVKSIPVSQSTLDALVSEGYLARHQLATVFSKAAGPTKLGFYRDTLKNMTAPGYEKFRSLVLDHFKRTGLQLIEYNWTSSLDQICRRKSVSAFNYVGSQPYDGRFNGISMISSDTPYPGKSNDEELLAARTFKFRGLIEQITTFTKRGLKIPKTLIVPDTYSKEEFAAVKSETFMCD